MSAITAAQIISDLKEKYKDDTDALEQISRREKDIEYLNKQEKQKDYKGQTALQSAKMLEFDLECWN